MSTVTDTLCQCGRAVSRVCRISQNESELSAACCNICVPWYPMTFKFTVSRIYMHDFTRLFSDSVRAAPARTLRLLRLYQYLIIILYSPRNPQESRRSALTLQIDCSFEKYSYTPSLAKLASQGSCAQAHAMTKHSPHNEPRPYISQYTACHAHSIAKVCGFIVSPWSRWLNDQWSLASIV